jgi:hypothetical protein
VCVCARAHACTTSVAVFVRLLYRYYNFNTHSFKDRIFLEIYWSLPCCWTFCIIWEIYIVICVFIWLFYIHVLYVKTVASFVVCIIFVNIGVDLL